MTVDLKKRTPEREQLAEAIQVVASSRKRLADIKSLYLEYLEKMEPTEEKLRQAQRELAYQKNWRGETKLSASEIVEHVARAAGQHVSKDLQDAAETVELLAAELDRDEKTRKALRRETPGAEDDVKRAEEKLQEAIYRVINSDPAVAALVEKFRRLQADANAIRAQVEAVLPAFSQKFPYWDRVPVPATSDDAGEWTRVLDLLKTDPDAAFPKVE